jgi:hypothetical protein
VVNIAITDASVVDTNENPITTVTIGEDVYIRADFTTQNLPSGASYRVAYTVNGLTRDSSFFSYGAGLSTGTGNEYWGTFRATPGTNQVIVTVDPDHSVAESTYTDNTISFSFNAVGPTSNDPSYTAAQIRAVYGLDSLPNFGTATADGSGQTIAIVDAGNDPTILSDLDDFDQAMSLTTTSSQTYYQQYGPASSILSVYNDSGVNITADIGTSGSNGVPDDLGWDGEVSIDVEWAHAIAPGAKIDLIETSVSSAASLLDGIGVAASLPDVSAISNSWAYDEWSGETAYDTSTLVTPPGHTGVTILAATGDDGTAAEYPASSPNVVGVGGTQLTIDNEAYGSEIGWSFPTPRTLNDGSSSYSQAGPWTSNTGGFSGTYGTASGGSNAAATWTTSIASSDQGWVGRTEVSATWAASPSNATNATYTIYDGPQSSGNVLGTVSVNQTKAPVGTADGGSQFQELGDYDPSSGSVTVVLNANTANGKVVADAVGISQAWASSGGPSRYETEPSYQLPSQSSGLRTDPDVSFDGSIDSGVDCYQAGGLGYGYFGTSLACPCWAGLIAIVNQGRVAAGGTTLNSIANPTQALQALYSLPSSDFHDVTAGYSGFSAGNGYDEVTGRGSPIANLLVPALVQYQLNGQLEVTGLSTSVVAGAPFGLTVTAEDASGDTLTGYNGSVTISLANDPGNGTLGGTLTMTAVDGIASFSGLTLDVADSGYQIQATANGATGATTNAFRVVAAPAEQLVISSQPTSSVTAGVGFRLTVEVEDQFGNLVATDQGLVTASLASGPTGSVLGGMLMVSAVDGVATFAGLTLNKAGTGDTLGLSRTGLSGATTNMIAVNPAQPAKLAIPQQQTGATAGVAFSLEVAVEDQFGNLETGDTGTLVTASLASGSGPLQGTTGVLDSGGIVTFTNLFDDKAEAITIGFAAPGLAAATSSRVVVGPAGASKLVIQAQPTTAAVGQPFAIQPQVYEEDQFGNLETGDKSTVVTASLASGAGPLLGTTMAVVSGGVATFKNLADGQIETITIAFGAPTLMGVTSNNIVVAKASTTTTWSASAATAIYKQSITLTATVAEIPGGDTPTGSVTFLDGATVLGTSPLDRNGHATFSTANLPLGTQRITVSYSGDPGDSPSTSPTASLYVGDQPKDDFDGDGKADIAIYDSTTSQFVILDSGGGSRIQPFGNPKDVNIPVSGDFDGDGKSDLAIYDQTTSTFYVLESGGGTIIRQFGNPNDVNIPVSGDFDGDGKSDIGIYDQTASEFIVLESGGGSIIRGFGNPADKNFPVSGDFDGDGKSDVGIYDQTASEFIILESGGGSIIRGFGNSKDVNFPVTGDFDGDGKADVGIYDQTASTFIVLESGGGTINQHFGSAADANIPLAVDLDGDGKDDLVLYDTALDEFFADESGGGTLALPFGTKGHANIPI